MAQKDVYPLWARAASRCAICRTELSCDPTDTATHAIREEAHIVSDVNDGPRGKSLLSPGERNSYSTLSCYVPPITAWWTSLLKTTLSNASISSRPNTTRG
jgi:hypothetical protein